MRRRLGLGLLVLLFNLQAYALEAVVNYNVFFMPSANSLKPYIELYWQLSPSTLHFDAGFTAKIKTDVILSNASGIVSEDHYIMQTADAGSVKEALSRNIFEFKKFIVPEGIIKLQVRLADVADTNHVYVFHDSVRISIPAGKPAFSGIQLLDTAYTYTQKNILLKNGRIQLPLCANFIDDGRNTLFYYTELYNTKELNIDDTPFVQTIFISKKPYDAVQLKLLQSDTISQTLLYPAFGKMNISELSSGNYYLNAILEDKNHKKQAMANLFFQRVNTKPESTTRSDTGFEKIAVFDLGETFVNKYTLAQLKAILKMLKPVSKPIESETIDNFLKQPDELYMRYFIYNFWKERNDKNPKAAWDSYTDVVKDVNRMFKGSGVPGYETERGITYLKYGKPNETISVENEQGAEPYEIWIYNTLPKQSNGGMILFYKPSFMMGEYQILHSTIRGETRNTNWRNQLYKAGKESTSMNSKAEQYFPGSK